MAAILYCSIYLIPTVKLSIKSIFNKMYDQVREVMNLGVAIQPLQLSQQSLYV